MIRALISIAIIVLVSVTVGIGLGVAMGHYYEWDVPYIDSLTDKELKPDYDSTFLNPFTKLIPDPTIPISRAFEIIEEATYTHQYYVDHPEDIVDGWGGVDFHREWVNKYDALKALIMELAGE